MSPEAHDVHDVHDGIESVGALAEPSRRALYDHVSMQRTAVSREQAAEAVGLPLHSVKFHLDRLVDEGLLEVEFRRLSGRQGPGAGRPSKLYRRARGEVSVSLPARQYDLAAAVLADAVGRGGRGHLTLDQAIDAAATDAGRALAVGAARPRGPRAELRSVSELLARHGYEPSPTEDETELELANCPFDRLAREHTDLVCGINLALVTGAVEALGCTHVQTRLEPAPDLCCVRARQVP
jgi:predicted ArsR family transcriptional regulator